ncbi:hypothetical protein ACCT18_05160 [Rhizobium ruizarguesonis]
MSDQSVWPKDIPETLWGFDLLSAERGASLPFMGVRLDWSFLFAFLFGAVMVAAFAWQRFKLRSFEPSESDFEVLKKLSPLQLRDSRSMRAAYIYYAGVMIAIYAALTFFGGLILTAVNYIPMAGIQAEVDQNSMTSPTWPLYLALGMAGFAPMLKPVEVVETWLRRKMHGWAGVPVEIKERTRRLLLGLDRAIQPAVQNALSSSENATASQITGIEAWIVGKVKSTPGWIKESLQRTGNEASVVRKWVELNIMVDAIKNPGSWPETYILDELHPIVREQRMAAEKALLAVEDIRNIKDPDRQIFLGDELNHRAKDLPLDQNNAEAKNSSNGELDSDSYVRRRRQVETLLSDIVAKIERSRLELAAILTVYAERSPYLETRAGRGNDRRDRHHLDETLRLAIEEVSTRHRQQPETGFWITALLLPIFIVYTVMTLLDLHSLLGTLQKTTATILATATVETLQIVAVFWLPAIVVIALWQYLANVDRPSSRSFPAMRLVVERRIFCVGLGWFVAAVGLVLLASLWTALVADSPERFHELIAGTTRDGPISNIILMLPKTLCTCIFVFLLVHALDRRERDKKPATIYAVVAAIIVIAAMFGLNQLTSFLSAQATDVQQAQVKGILARVVALASSPNKLTSLLFATPTKTQNASMFSLVHDVYRYYNLTDYIVYFSFVLATIGSVIWQPDTRRELRGRPDRRGLLERSAATGPGTLTFLVVLVSFGMAYWLVFAAQAAFAQSSGGKAIVSKIPISVGFRKNAEPFSYEAGPGPADNRHYRGYVADLCYSIFSDSKYEIVETEVTAQDRFDRITAAGLRGPKIDVLCDPTTLRFWRDMEPEPKEVEGFFSPIIFVTGVSYLLRPTTDRGPGIDLAFVKGTTAYDVARQACAMDVFRAVQRPGDPKSRCDVPSGSCLDQKGASIRLCGFESYDQAMDWFCIKSERQLVYFGDREIIQAKLKSREDAKNCNAKEVVRKATYYTYEPYALLVAADQEELARFVQKRVYDFFSHRDKAIGLFSSYFPDVQMSPMMANLFLLNAIDSPMYETVPGDQFDHDKSQSGRLGSGNSGETIQVGPL